MTLEEVTTLKEAIKRLKEVIKEVRSTIQPFLYDNEAKDYILKALEQPKWIPVSERLPESAGVYIISRWFSDGCESMILTDACYFDGTSTWHNDNRINHSRDYVDEKIIAWMPLPEPYKAESEE